MFKTKIYIGIAVIVVLGMLAMLYIYRGVGDVAGYLATLNRVGVPFSIAALEMEKNTGEYANGVLRYIGDPEPAVREEAINDLNDFSERYAVYKRLSADDRQRALGQRVAKEHEKLRVAGNALMDQRDKLDKLFQETTDLLDQIDGLTDEQMLAAAPEKGLERSTALAAIANIEAETAEVGFWLAMFRSRPTSHPRTRLLDKIREQQGALSGYLELPLGANERKLGTSVNQLHLRIASNVNQLIIGETDISQRAVELDRMAARIDDIFDNEVQSMLLKGLSAPQENADVAMKDLQETLRYVIPGYFLIALIVGLLLILAIIRPLKRLAAGTEAIGARDLDYRIVARGNDEFGQLARRFNEMAARLKESTVSRDLLEASERQLQRTVAELRQEIAERRQAERERERLQTQLQRTKTLAAMGRLVAGVAHEVRNPLFGISSTLDAMEANAETGHVDSRFREVLRREASRLNALMTALLEYGRMPPAETGVEPLGKCIAESIRSCQPIAKSAGVSLVDACVEDASVKMNRDRLQQVFVNLIENAVQHSPQGSAVVVATRATVDPAGQRWIECTVADAGSGIAREDLPLVFDPFFTRRRKGTGLGLAIAHRIVDEHRGTIEPANRPQGGAVMTVRLPIAES